MLNYNENNNNNNNSKSNSENNTVVKEIEKKNEEAIVSPIIVTKQLKKPRIFYFGITHSSRMAETYAADATWGKRCMPDGFPWFSDEPDPKNILKNLTVIKHPTYGASRNFIYFRTLLTWQYVLKTFGGWDWVGWFFFFFFF